MSEMYQKLKVTNWYTKATRSGTTLTVGVSATLKVYARVKAKTIFSVYEKIQEYQSDFSKEKLEEIEKSKAGEGLGFFTCLFGIMANSQSEYFDRTTEEDIQDITDSQAAAKAFDLADESEVIIEGEVIATGLSYIPTEAHVFVNLTEVSIDGKTSIAVPDNILAKAADVNGDDSKVEGSEILKKIDSWDLDDPNHPQRDPDGNLILLILDSSDKPPWKIYKDLIVQNGFTRGTKTGTTVSIGGSAVLKVYMKLKAKTIHTVYESIQKYQDYFSKEAFEKIETSKVGGGLSFYACLFDIMSNSQHEYYNKTTDASIQDVADSQAAAKVLDSADEAEVIMERDIEVTGTSYLPIEAHVYVNITLVTIDGEQSISITEHPQAKATDINGDDSKVEGSGTLIVVHTWDLDDPDHPQRGPDGNLILFFIPQNEPLGMDE